MVFIINHIKYDLQQGTHNKFIFSDRNNNGHKRNNLVRSWRNARFTAVIAAIPLLIIATGHFEAGLSLLLGELPASIIGLPLTRKQRRKIIVIGILIGVFLMLSSFMAQWAIVAIPRMFLLAFGAALLLSRRTIGIVALTICLPLAGVGQLSRTC